MRYAPPKDPEKRKEYIEKLRVGQRRRWADPEERVKQSNRQKVSQNRPETKAKRSASSKKLWADPEYRDKQTAAQKAIQKIAQNRPEVNARRIASLKVATNRPEVRARRSASSRESQNRPEVKKKHVERMKRFWADPENRVQRLQALHQTPRNKQNMPEKRLGELLQELFSNQWKYVGDCRDKDFIIGGKIPDFVHTKLPKIIEMNGDFWHGEKRTGRTKEEEEQQRIDLFAKEGYQTLIVWQHELKEIHELTRKLLDFCGCKDD